MNDGNQSQAQEQNKKQYDWLKWYQFTKGVSWNPWGRPKGSKSLKTFAREYLENLPDEEKIKFLECLPPEIVWRMSEGNPHATTDVTTNWKELPTPIISLDVLSDNRNPKSS